MAREYTIHAARAKLSVAMDANESIAAMFLLSTTNMFKVLPLVTPRKALSASQLPRASSSGHVISLGNDRVLAALSSDTIALKLLENYGHHDVKLADINHDVTLADVRIIAAFSSGIITLNLVEKDGHHVTLADVSHDVTLAHRFSKCDTWTPGVHETTVGV
ncbi:hypothetical protein BgiBS90_018424 [Biomphalaria glabrata]|nr:hypothetical protein BgiBS90_018424 [Biomphalaria glabrata]